MPWPGLSLHQSCACFEHQLSAPQPNGAARAGLGRCRVRLLLDIALHLHASCRVVTYTNPGIAKAHQPEFEVFATLHDAAPLGEAHAIRHLVAQAKRAGSHCLPCLHCPSILNRCGPVHPLWGFWVLDGQSRLPGAFAMHILLVAPAFCPVAAEGKEAPQGSPRTGDYE